MILTFDDYALQSSKLAGALDMPCHVIQSHRFPDGETRLTLPPNLPEHVLICRSLNHPNEKLLELLLAAKTARELGARVLTLIAPYLCYMRQDTVFHPGEAISQKIVGNFLAGLFDHVITVDPHLHRTLTLEQAIPTTRAVTLSATGLMTNFLRQQYENPVILGPDEESGQWVAAVAEPYHWAFGVCQKIRSGDQTVTISLPEINLQGRRVVIVDDVASSGQTLAVASRQCLSRKAQRVDVLVTHALFGNDANKLLLEAGVRNIWSTDSVSHESNVIALDELLKNAVLTLGNF